MDYLPTIYACGDAYYLGKVLDAVAMICGTNGGLVGATAVGALIGVIIIAFQTVIRLNGINIHHMLVCWVIYVISFGTTTDVAIQSVYSDGSVVQKDNVPAGPAWIGVIVSNIGYHMTKKMEQAFGDVDERAVITNNNGNGFANALYILNHMSQFGEKGPLRAAMAKTTTGRDLLTNLTVYTRDCTTKAIYLGPKWGGKTYEQIITQPFEKAFEFESKIYFTEVRNAGQTLELSCTDAWKTITEQMNGKAFDEIDTFSVQELANKAGFCTRKADGSSSCDVETPDELMNKFQRTSLNALSDSSVKAQKYMLTSVGRNILNLGLAQGYATYKDTNSAAMLAQAIEQRNVQWAAEQSMFLNSVRPMMAFMESFFYALTPFAAVFVMLGLFGLGLFFKYILLLIWVQMWLPVMAIANMYIMSAAKREMNSIISGFAGQNFDAAKNGSISIYAYDQMLGAAKDWVATGAMFQAATPLLSLIIISGSVYALTSLTSRMAGADHINEKIVAPDVVAPAAAMGIQPRYKVDANGYMLNGYSDASLNLQQMLSQTSGHVNKQMNGLTGTLQSLNAAQFSKMGSDIQQGILTGSYMQGLSNADSSGFQQLVSKIEQGMRTNGQTGDLHTKATEYASSLGLSVLGNGVGIKNSDGSRVSSQEARSKLQSMGISISDSDVTTATKAVNSALVDAASRSKSVGESGGFVKQSQEVGANLSSLQEESTQLDSLQNSVTWARSVKSAEIAAVIDGKPEALKLLNDTWNRLHASSPEMAQMMDSSYNKAMNERDGDPISGHEDTRLKIITLSTLDTNGNNVIDNQNEYDAQKTVLAAIGDSMYTPQNGSLPNMTNVGQHAGTKVTPNQPVGYDSTTGNQAKNGADGLTSQSIPTPQNVYDDGNTKVKIQSNTSQTNGQVPADYDYASKKLKEFKQNGGDVWFDKDGITTMYGLQNISQNMDKIYEGIQDLFKSNKFTQFLANNDIQGALNYAQNSVRDRLKSKGILQSLGGGGSNLSNAAIDYATQRIVQGTLKYDRLWKDNQYIFTGTGTMKIFQNNVNEAQKANVETAKTNFATAIDNTLESLNGVNYKQDGVDPKIYKGATYTAEDKVNFTGNLDDAVINVAAGLADSNLINKTGAILTPGAIPSRSPIAVERMTGMGKNSSTPYTGGGAPVLTNEAATEKLEYQRGEAANRSQNQAMENAGIHIDPTKWKDPSSNK